MDEYIASAKAHWAPRFTANGVPAVDFERVTKDLQSWDEWCAAFSTGAELYEELGAAALSKKHYKSAGAHYRTAAAFYHFAKFVFVRHYEEMKVAHMNAVRCRNIAIKYIEFPGERVEIPFEGAKMVGILRKPHGEGPFPIVILVPGLDSTKEEFLPTENLFLERGMAILSIDGPGQGEAEYDLPIRADWEVPGRAIVDYLETRSDVDPEKIAVWGVSLGGYYAPRFASGDPRIKACVSLCGPYNLGKIWDQLPDLTRETYTVRSFSKNQEDAQKHALNLTNEGRFDLIKCPTLIVAGKVDRLFPWEDAVKVHEATKSVSELLLLERGNHGCANVPNEHRYFTADWMAEKLGLAANL